MVKEKKDEKVEKKGVLNKEQYDIDVAEGMDPEFAKKINTA